LLWFALFSFVGIHFLVLSRLASQNIKNLPIQLAYVRNSLIWKKSCDVIQLVPQVILPQNVISKMRYFYISLIYIFIF
jgi:hypothetical protein